METGSVRSPTLKDLARLVDYLDNINFFLRSVAAKDVPKAILDVNKYYACLSNTRRHVMASAYSISSVKVGPGGNFLTQKQTIKHMRSEMFDSKVSDRSSCEKWKEEGEKGYLTKS